MGRKIKTYVQVNSGLQRCGREPGEETVELVKSIIGLPGIEIIGLITHAGFSYDYVGGGQHNNLFSSFITLLSPMISI